MQKIGFGLRFVCNFGTRRAAIEDGFKPVQRRIIHSMKVDGRYVKSLFVVGHMQYITHGSTVLWCHGTNWSKDLIIDMRAWGKYLNRR
jgi:topoisomerase-4 subunit A